MRRRLMGSDYSQLVFTVWEQIKQEKAIFAVPASNTSILNKLIKLYNAYLTRDLEDVFRPVINRVSCWDRLDVPNILVLKFQLLHLLVTQMLRYATSGSEIYQQASVQKELLEELEEIVKSFSYRKGCMASTTLITLLTGAGAAVGAAGASEPDQDKADTVMYGVVSVVFGTISIGSVWLAWQIRKGIQAKIVEQQQLTTQLAALTLLPEAKATYHVNYVFADTHPVVFLHMLRVINSVLQSDEALSCLLCYRKEKAQRPEIEVVVEESKASEKIEEKATVSEESKLAAADEDEELQGELSYAVTKTSNLGGPYCTPCIHSQVVQNLADEEDEEKSVSIKDPSTNEPLLLDSLKRAQLVTKDNILGQWMKVKKTYPVLFQPAQAAQPAAAPVETTPALSTTTSSTTTTTTVTTAETTTTAATTTTSPSLLSRVSSVLRQNWLGTRFPSLPKSASALSVQTPQSTSTTESSSASYMRLGGGPTVD